MAQVTIPTRVFHKPTVTPDGAESAPGQGPQPVVIGTVMGLDFNSPTDKAYRILKVDSNIVPQGNPSVTAYTSFHVHWTKSGDVDESGNVVRWRLEYTVFDGASGDVALATPSVVEWDDTYDDGATLTRIVYRTSNVEVTDLTPNYYVGVALEYVPANTTLSSSPVVISADLLWRGFLHEPA